MKVLLIVGGSLAALFTFAQLLQLLGLLGAGSSIAGLGFVALGLAATIACFKKAFKDDKWRRRHRT